MVATSSKLYGKITLKGIRMLSEHLSNYTLVGARKVQIIKKNAITSSWRFYEIS